MQALKQISLLPTGPRFTWQGEAFVFGELLHDSQKTLVYRAQGCESGRLVIIKMAQPAVQNMRLAARLRHEYELLKGLDFHGIRRALDFVNLDGHFAMVLEDVGAVPLKELIMDPERPLALPLILELFATLMDLLAKLHTRGIIHKDINPSNILVHPATGQLYLIDFDIAATLSREQAALDALENIEGTLAYLSPEQTGRTGHPLDERSDLYSAGITFYEVLTGKLPFVGKDAMEMIYFHLARDPHPPSESHPQSPEMLSRILMRLLAKDPARRYLSAFGVKADVVRIKEHLEHRSLAGKLSLATPCPPAKPDVELFELGSCDVPLRLTVSESFYGGEQAQTLLLEEFAGIMQCGSALALIGAPAGFGKTSLVHQLSRSLLASRAHIVIGKFDEMRRDIPYDAILSALRKFVHNMLMQSQETIASWRKAIVERIGPNGQLLIDAMPEMVAILGEQQAVSPMAPNEHKKRFQQCLTQFVHASHFAGAPMVLFLDDLQWADHASLELLHQFVREKTAGNLLLIGAYRDNELTAAHPLSVSLKEWRASDISMHEIRLAPLGLAPITALCVDTFQLEPAAVEPLAAVILAKTQGNPLFVHQFLRALYRDGHINFDAAAGRWTFDVQRIAHLPFTDNVIDLLRHRLDSLEPQTLHILRSASCCGMKFNLYTVAKALGMPMANVARKLEGALRESFLLAVGDAHRYIEAFFFVGGDGGGAAEAAARDVVYGFVHDRVREACNAGITVDERRLTHLKLGRVIRGSIGRELDEHELMDTLGHLNAARTLITDWDERMDIARLNFAAGQRAKASCAWTIGIALFNHGIHLLPSDCWERFYDLTRDLHIGLGTCHMLGGERDQAEAIFDLLLTASSDRLQSAFIQYLRYELYLAMAAHEKALHAGLDGLTALGVRFNRRPTVVSLLGRITSTRISIARRSFDTIVNMPAASHPGHDLAMRLTVNLATVCMIEYPLLAAELICSAVDLTFKHGICQYTAHVFLQFACVLSTGTMDKGIPFWWGDEVRRLCRLWRALAERWPSDEHHYLQNLTFNMLLSHWGERMKEDQCNADQLFPHFVARDDFTYAQHALASSMDHRFILGDNTVEIGAHTEKYIEYVAASDFQPFSAAWLNSREGILALAWADSGDEVLRQAEKLAGQYPQYAPITFCMDKMMQGIMYFLAEDYDRAFSSLQACAKAKIQLIFGGAPKAALFYLYYGMAASRLYRRAAKFRRAKLYAAILICRQRLFLFRAMSHSNFSGHFAMLEGNWRHMRGAPLRVYLPFYEKAIAQARERGFANLEGHAAEALAEALAEAVSNESPARLALGPLSVAHHAYQRWGIRCKTRKMAAAIAAINPALGPSAFLQKNAAATGNSSLGQGSRTSLAKAMSSTSDDSSSSLLDIPTLIQAAQALAGEIEIDALKSKLMHLVCENAGARRAHLLMAKDNEPISSETLRIVASAHSMDQLAIDVSVRFADNSSISVPAVMSVMRTREQLIVGDVSSELAWQTDPSLMAREIRSLFVLPIIAAGALKAVLYLESDLIPHAFTAKHVEVLATLAGQIAISLENANLYAKLTRSLTSEKEARRKEQAAHEDYVNAERERSHLAAGMEAARAVQESLLMTAEPDASFQIAYLFRPAEKAGGDWFGSYLDQAKHRLYILLGDVTGHGISSALVTAAAAGAAASAIDQVKKSQESSEDALNHIAQAIHEAVRCTGSPSQRVMTMSMIALNLDTGEGRYLNAGHPASMLWTGENTRFVHAIGDLMGIDGMQCYGHTAFQMAAGEQILLYSDGLLENRNKERRLLKCRDLQRILRPTQSPHEAISALTPIIDGFVADEDTDDTALICLQWLGG